jgi:hypothetical protein
MTVFATAQENLLTEIEKAIETITPDVESRKPFQRYKGKAATIKPNDKTLIGPRQFFIAPGRRVGLHGMGYGYQFPLYEYDITVQYPAGDYWSGIMHSDLMLIHYKLLNTKTTVDGCQNRWIKADAPVTTDIDESNEKQSITMTVTVYYETTDTA